ncbi:ABC transporter ATP-binding protein [Roseomonas elaeocarpi]|uniref:Oligopeptide/dipeptide ABC transporter ATP-binding protein n=1 Tax=Roseomonas elaeocarpi TaxID=907779 RepID=A0ABV6JX60_9PROT
MILGRSRSAASLPLAALPRPAARQPGDATALAAAPGIASADNTAAGTMAPAAIAPGTAAPDTTAPGAVAAGTVNAGTGATGRRAAEAPLLECQALRCELGPVARPVRVLHGIDLRLAPRRALGIVGESGAGKSMLIKTVMGLQPAGARVGGRVVLGGTDLGALREDRRRALLGRRVGMVFQNPMTSLNPFVRVGQQMEEASRFHRGLNRAEARALAISLLRIVGIPDAEACHRQYPHQFSGGMKQRIMIATALACEPELLIADEATTALDVTVQREILDLLGRLQAERHMSMILVTHNLGIVAGRTDEVLVLYAGRVVEHGPTEAVFRRPRHRYTEALLAAMPRLDQPAHARLRTIPGQPPNLVNPPAGCPFAPRCPAAEARCHREMPPETSEPTSDGVAHRFSCWVPVDRAAAPVLAEALP